jgi:hypothetical protein
MKRICLITLVAAGCGGGGEEDPAEHACEHAGMAGTPVTAAAAADASAPALELDGEPVAVALPAGAAGFVRIVTTEPETAGILFFDATDVLAAVRTADGTELPVTSAGANEICPTEIPEHFDIDFETPGSYFIELGPTVSNGAWVIPSGGEGHAHGAGG